MRRLSYLAILVCLALLGGTGWAEAGQGQGQGHGKNKVKVVKVKPSAYQGTSPSTGGTVASVIITSTEQTLLRRYFTSGRLPVAYQYQALPPGIAKNVARGKPLPPGIAKKQLPPDLLTQLPARPGYEYRIVGADVVLVAVATGLVVDILLGVLN